MWDIGAPVRAEAATALAGFDGPVAEDGLAHALADPAPAPSGRLRSTRIARAAAARPPSSRCSQGVVSWPFPSDYAALEQAIAILVDWAPEGMAEDVRAAAARPERARRSTSATRTRSPRCSAADPARPGRGRRARGRPGGRARSARVGGTAPQRAEQLLRWLGPAGGDSVLRRARERHRRARRGRAAAAALRDSRAVEPLVALLGASDPAVRAARRRPRSAG